jgi:hypothetical protein
MMSAIGLDVATWHPPPGHMKCTVEHNNSERPFPLSFLVLPKHADEHRPQHPVLLAVDQELGMGARLGVPQ